jgi:methylphosphotriester-DNA--protein-cysteine methyltransferase
MAYRLLDRNGKEYASDVRGTLGGYKPKKIYGKLDCRSALRAIARGGYAGHRVFFADEATAIAAGYRPCAKCCPAEYQAWKSSRPGTPT